MKAGESLAAWLGDPARQAETDRAAEQLAGRWTGHALFEELTGRLDGIEGDAVGPAIDAASRFFDRRADLERLFGALLESARADPFFAPPLRTVASEISTGFLLYSHPALAITLAVMSADGLAAKRVGPAGPASLTFSGRATLYEFVRSGGATLSFWEAPAIGAGFAAAASGRCRMRERRRVGDGERFLLDGARASFVIEHAVSDLVILSAAVQSGSAPVSVEYDTRTLAFAGASGNDEANSRVQMMVTLLRLMDRADAVPAIERLIADLDFHARWHVMRELLALDAEAALPGLRRMAASDPHAEVRAAAQAALAMFFEDEAWQGSRLCRA